MTLSSLSSLCKGLGSLSALILLGPDRIDVCLVGLALLQIHQVELPPTCIVLSWPVDVVFTVLQELHPVGDPSCNAGDGEKNWVHVSWKAHGSVNKSAVEVNVRVQLASNAISYTTYKY